MPSYPQAPPGASKELMSLGPDVTTTSTQPPRMKPGSTYIQRLPSGRLAFVRRPVKIAPASTVLADAFIRYPSASCAKVLQSVGKGYMLPSHGGETYPQTPNPMNHSGLNPYVYPLSNQVPPTGPRALGANTPLFCDCFRGFDDPDSTAASQPLESIYVCVNCGRFQIPSYSRQNLTAIRPASPSRVCRKCREPSDSSEGIASKRHGHRGQYKDIEKRRGGNCLSSRQNTVPNCSYTPQSWRSYCTCRSCSDQGNGRDYSNIYTRYLPRLRNSPINARSRRLIHEIGSSSEWSYDTEDQDDNCLRYSRSDRAPRDWDQSRFRSYKSNRGKARTPQVSSADDERGRPSRKILRFARAKRERVGTRYLNTSEDSYEVQRQPSSSRTRTYETRYRDDTEDRVHRSSSRHSSPRGRWSTRRMKRDHFYHGPPSSPPQFRSDYRHAPNSKGSKRWTQRPEITFHSPGRNNRHRRSSRYRSTEDEWVSSYKRESPKTDGLSQPYLDEHRYERPSRPRESFTLRDGSRNHPGEHSHFEQRQPSAIEITTW